ncbi:glycoside hydrolase family 2 TIM barrel-domain containing protein [Victivallis vadensis]|uniref:glycoside hydrolase family 2 TIM barrel-domain containing protein n=1 Tax=Victivallis vadensis TaxID=172901 RepID=UPI0026DCC699|nr:glycoside hydrolase family 2 TIM barrel-domain containing protein [Victivallis vadensis]
MKTVITFLALCLFFCTSAGQILCGGGSYRRHSANLLNESTLFKGKIQGVSAAMENGKAAFSVESSWASCNNRIPIPNLESGWKNPVLLVRFKMRSADCVRGKEGWQNARLDLFFLDAAGKRIPPYLKTNQLVGTNPWREYADAYPIPPNAAFFDLLPINYGPSGKLEIKELEVILASEEIDVAPPDGRTTAEVFSLNDAWRLSTPTREQISLNGLWQFRPCIQKEDSAAVPAQDTGWGWFKVPGHWPGTLRNNSRLGSATPFYLSSYIRRKMPRTLYSAWYRRVIAIPGDWRGRRILLKLDLVQSKAAVRIDGKSAGVLFFPGGELDVSSHVTPGGKHEIAILVEAEPRILTVNMGETRAYTELREMDNRGLCGEAMLEAIPPRHSISDTAIRTFVGKRQIEFDVGFHELVAGTYLLEATVSGPDGFSRTFPAKTVMADGKGGTRFSLIYDWIAPRLWDIDTPENLYTVEISLKDLQGHILDRFYPEEFGFREFGIEGRNFLLNGKIIHLRALPIDNSGASSIADEASVTELVRKMREFHVNFLIDSVYSFNPGTFCYQDAYRKTTSRLGILTSITMPRSLDFPGLSGNPELQERFRKIAGYRLRRYQNLPGLVMLATSHNYAGYSDHQNPLKIANGFTPERHGICTGTRMEALCADGLLKKLDPTRPVYHHDAGMLGAVHAVNLYQNWAPPQERSDWLEDWEKNGKAPVFFTEYGMPHIASWSSNRGPGFIWLQKAVQCFWLDEFNAETLGEQAYRQEEKKREYFSRKSVTSNQSGNRPRWFFWPESPQLDQVRAAYVWKNIRDLRGRGISALLPWDSFAFHSRQTSVPDTVPNPERFRNLKCPGLVPDYKAAFQNHCFSDPLNTYQYSLTGKALEEAFREILMWIGGAPGDFTESSLHFSPGETVEKSIVILNDSRQEQSFDWLWKRNGTKEEAGNCRLAPGTKTEIPIRFRLSAESVTVTAEVRSGNGELWSDSITLHPIQPPAVRLQSKVGLYDPEGTAAPLLDKLGIPYQAVSKTAELDDVELLILGRHALDRFPLHLEEALKQGMKLLILEQSARTLSRIGIRSNTQGLRTVFPAGREFPELLENWRGSSTLLPPYLELPEIAHGYPAENWNGFINRRIWRSGNRGNVAAVLPEKPSVGNWLPLYQGGFDLQFAPLLLMTEGRSRILFCQLEISARTVQDPQAEQTLAKALRYLDDTSPAPVRKVWYSGNEKLRTQLEQTGVVCEKIDPAKLSSGDLLVLGPGEAVPGNLRRRIQGGLNVLACGLTGAELSRFVPEVNASPGEWMSDWVDGLGERPEYRGIGNAELHFRYPLRFDGFPKDSTGGISLNSIRIGRGILVMMQLPPWRFDRKVHATRTTARRADFLLMRLLANLGAEFRTGFFAMFDGMNHGNFSFPLAEGWKGKFDPENSGKSNGWQTAPADGWKNVKVGTPLESQFPEHADYDGLFWYRLEFDLPEACRNGEYELRIGAVDDESWIWLNGRFTGEVTAQTHPENYWNFNRSIVLKKELLSSGKQVLTVLCNDLGGVGGMLAVPRIVPRSCRFFHVDRPEATDDPYRYYHW